MRDMYRRERTSGGLPGAMQVFNQTHDHIPRPKIQAAGWFIGEQHPRIPRQCACQYHPLLFSPRKLARAMCRTVT